MFNWWVTLGLLIIILIGVGVYLIIKHDVSSETCAGITMGTIIIFVILSAIYFLISISNSKEVNVQYEYKNKEYIYSLEDNMSIDGKYTGFIIGYGQVDSNIYYYSLVGDNKNGFVVKKYNSSDTFIITDEDNKPYYIEKYKSYDMEYEKNWFFGELIKPFTKDHIEELNKKELHLSKNYIKQSYNIDLK